jgi:hypothetical protein
MSDRIEQTARAFHELMRKHCIVARRRVAESLSSQRINKEGVKCLVFS